MSNRLRRQFNASLAVTPAKAPTREERLLDLVSALRSSSCLENATTAFHTVEDQNFTHRYHFKRAVENARSLRDDLTKFILAVDAAQPAAVPSDEQSCPGHVASDSDPKVCGRCGIHIDSLRPDDGEA